MTKDTSSHRALLEEGMLTGLVGAGLVAMWFLFLDAMQEVPFSTPALLGHVIFDGLSATKMVTVSTKTVFAYSGLHIILFLLVGWGMAWMFREFRMHPHFGILYLMLFLLFEIIIFGLEVAIMPDVLGVLGTWTVVVANGVSAIGMFFFLWKNHPEAIACLVQGWRSK